jgi:hypothetical protein
MMPEVYDKMCQRALADLELPQNVVFRLNEVSRKYKEFVNK